jgi:hypothetical protein
MAHLNTDISIIGSPDSCYYLFFLLVKNPLYNISIVSKSFQKFIQSKGTDKS